EQLELSSANAPRYRNLDRVTGVTVDQNCSQLQTIDFSGNSFLKQLYVHQPPNLKEIKIGRCTQISHLFVECNSLQKLQMFLNRQLESILLHAPLLPSIDLISAFNLKSLILR